MSKYINKRMKRYKRMRFGPIRFYRVNRSSQLKFEYLRTIITSLRFHSAHKRILTSMIRITKYELSG